MAGSSCNAKSLVPDHLKFDGFNSILQLFCCLWDPLWLVVAAWVSFTLFVRVFSMVSLISFYYVVRLTRK